MKLKRTVQDALAHACQAKVASHLLHYSELQAFCSAPYPTYHPHLVPDGPTTAPYLQPHSMLYNSSPASQTLPGVSTLPMDSLYQYATLPGLMVPSSASSLVGAHQPYLHQYWNIRHLISAYISLVQGCSMSLIILHLPCCSEKFWAFPGNPTQPLLSAKPNV